MLPIYIMEIEDIDERQWAARLYTQYNQYLCRLIQTYVPLQDTDDILQDIFMEVIQHSARLKGYSEKRMFSYLMRIVHSRSLNALRKLKREKEWHMGEEGLEDLYSYEASPEEQAIYRMTCDQAGKLLEKVDERYRNVFLLKYSQHLNDSEIARLTGLSKKSVWIYVNRAQRKLLDLTKQEENHYAKAE